ncbi:hypothetical protein MKX03_026124 [Papaver bracteatum]|nr:hypothetical protein MKX03_026124 [Papaver bracteatum]
MLRQAEVVSPPLTRGRNRAVLSAGRTYSTALGRGLLGRGRRGTWQCASTGGPEDKQQS